MSNYYAPAVGDQEGYNSPSLEQDNHDEVEQLLNQGMHDPVHDAHDDDSNAAVWTPPTQMTPEKPKTEEEIAADSRRQKMLVLSFLLMVIVGLGNRIFNVLQFIPMNRYPLWINEYTTFVYLPACFLYIWPMQKWGSQITSEATSIPKYKFAVMGVLDSIAGIMQSLATNYIVNGSLITLLSQAAIPVSMIISKIFLKTKYTATQYIGSLIVAGGLAVVLIPVFVNPPNADDQDVKPRDVPLWSVIMILSMVPQCLSSVYKEKALGEVEIDVVYLNGWVALFQFLVSIPLLLPSAPASNLSITDIPSNLWGGTKCYVGIDTVTDNADDKTNDHCGMSPIYVNIYLFFNILYNILIIMILKYGSSNMLWLAMTVMVPLSNVAFSLDFMPNRQDLQATDIAGLVVILSGLVFYRFAAKFWKRLKPVLSKLGACIANGCRFPSENEMENSLLGVAATPDSPMMFGKPGSGSAGGGGSNTPALNAGGHHMVKQKREEQRKEQTREERRRERAKGGAKPSSRAVAANKPINSETP